MAREKKPAAIYPEKPATKSGYTDEWISAYLADKATARQINKYVKEIAGKKKAERRTIFYDMFIAPKDKFTTELLDLGKKKADEEKAKREAKKQAKAAAE